LLDYDVVLMLVSCLEVIGRILGQQEA
jgi:hypothetical protein